MASPIAYFSAEIWLDDLIPTYSGGLGVLAGDTLRSAADLGVDLVAITLLYHGGYFEQQLSPDGEQRARPVAWDPAAQLERTDHRVEIQLGGRTVVAAVWKHELRGVGGHVVPTYLLDTNVHDNHEHDRLITDRLYGGDNQHRLDQEAVLGLAGFALLEQLGRQDALLHLNEGHASFAALQAYAVACAEVPHADAVTSVKSRCSFTTHTPVPAGHDRFPNEAVADALGPQLNGHLDALLGPDRAEVNMTHIGLALAGYCNGVAKRHAEVSRAMFPQHTIDAITNGVHSVSWTAPRMQEVFDEHLPGWRADSTLLAGAESIELRAIAQARRDAKGALLAEVERRTGVSLDPKRFTLGFARRATAYKRAALILSDPDRLRAIAAKHGGIRIIYAGKAHPRDESGQSLIRSVVEAGKELGPEVELVYVPGYETPLGRLITSGVDVWLNTPRAPMEASGTSGMKAAHNAVPNLSVLDGWWCEGCEHGVTGWGIEPWRGPDGADADTAHAQTHARSALEAEGDQDAARSLYRILEEEVLPLFDRGDEEWLKIGRAAIARCGSVFNGHRMMREYLERAYTRP